MTTKKQRVNVTFSDNEYEALALISKERDQSISSFVRIATKAWIEDYEDENLLETLQQRENQPTISHEEFWAHLSSK